MITGTQPGGEDEQTGGKVNRRNRQEEEQTAISRQKEHTRGADTGADRIGQEEQIGADRIGQEEQI